MNADDKDDAHEESPLPPPNDLARARAIHSGAPLEPAAARSLLKSDREAFIAACPSLGLRERIARPAFSAPRHIDACLFIFDEWQRGTAPAVAACVSESLWPLPVTP
jgi:hypothetical protein